MQNIQSNQIEKTVAALLKGNAWKATNYLSDKVIVRASRQMHGKKLSNQGNLTVILTVGKPNYAEREFIAVCKKAGEKFPLKKVVLKFPPKTERAKLQEDEDNARRRENEEERIQAKLNKKGIQHF